MDLSYLEPLVPECGPPVWNPHKPITKQRPMLQSPTKKVRPVEKPLQAGQVATKVAGGC